MISLFAVMLVLMGVPALCLSTNTVVDELGTLTNTALLTGRNWGTGILSNGGYYYRYGMAFVWLLPFLIFKEDRKMPGFVQYIGKYLPSAVFGMLVVYCLKNVDVLEGNRGLPELIAILVTSALHVWKRQMLLVRFVF